MKRYQWFILAALLGIGLRATEVSATADPITAAGSIQVIGSEVTSPIDPENPLEVVDPGAGPSTKGALRIDYVSSLNFNKARIDTKNRTYSALAQQFFSETGPRGSYIQITDQRAQSTGWSVQVKQNHQFRNSVIQAVEEQELQGAVLSLDKGWANSSSESDSPTVTRGTVALTSMDTVYEVATAETGAGRGIWAIVFGASDTNINNQTNTLAPVKDRNGKAVTDEVYGKSAYSNSAITLMIPETTKIYPVEYETTLTWILGEWP